MVRFTRQQKLLFTGLICPYCGAPTELISSSEIYGDKAAPSSRSRICRPCQAWVSCHPYSDQAQGSVAKASLRKMRYKAHQAFDRIWREGFKSSRFKAYSWLSLRLGIPRHLVHMAYFNEEECERTIEICHEYISAHGDRTAIQGNKEVSE